MIETFQEDYGVEVIHAWGMTEMSPLGTLGSMKPEYAGLDRHGAARHPGEAGPRAVRGRDEDHRRRRQALPRDGKTFGRFKVRGPADRPSLFQGQHANILDADGFFDTGDVATIDRHGYMQITDRAKDVIKSGGEWISSIELENLAVGHPKVAEAAVIGVKHPKWDERPLLDHGAQEGSVGEQGRHSAIHAGQDRQMVDAGRCRLRR